MEHIPIKYRKKRKYWYTILCEKTLTFLYQNIIPFSWCIFLLKTIPKSSDNPYSNSIQYWLISIPNAVKFSRRSQKKVLRAAFEVLFSQPMQNGCPAFRESWIRMKDSAVLFFNWLLICSSGISALGSWTTYEYSWSSCFYMLFLCISHVDVRSLPVRSGSMVFHLDYKLILPTGLKNFRANLSWKIWSVSTPVVRVTNIHALKRALQMSPR